MKVYVVTHEHWIGDHESMEVVYAGIDRDAAIAAARKSDIGQLNSQTDITVWVDGVETNEFVCY